MHAAGAGLLCPLCFTKADITAARRRTGFEGSAVALVGAAAAVIPFVVQAASAQVAGASHDWVAVAAGVVAALCGGSTIVAARARASGGWLLVGALALALGVYDLARGAGLVGQDRAAAGRHQVASRNAAKITMVMATPSAR